MGYDQVNASAEPPACQDPEGFSEVAVKLPPLPEGEEVAATNTFAALADFGKAAVLVPGKATSAATVPSCVSVVEAREVWVRQAGTAGVVNAQAGKVTRCSRDAQSPPNASANCE